MLLQILSRAFRNRFVELHFDEIPSVELETILHQRCDLPLSYAKRLVAVMLELQVCMVFVVTALASRSGIGITFRHIR